MSTTDPIDEGRASTAPRLAIAPSYTAPDGSVYVHTDLHRVVDAWAVEEHIRPTHEKIALGDVESWVAYVRRFAGGGEEFAPLLTWGSRGLSATLDYHSAGEPDRCQWVATMPFTLSPEWRAWTALANNHAIPHRAAIERLEDLAGDILEPAPADLMALLRTLRASVNATASTDLRADGTTSVSFQQDKKIVGGGSIDLPPEFTIGIRVLTGHVGEDGRPVLYKLAVRLRASVDDAAHLALRFAIPGAERVLEDVYADRVEAARKQLGDGYALLRAAD